MPKLYSFFRIYSEEQPGEASTALFIKHIEADDGGVYSCKATYAANQQITAEVKISVYGRHKAYIFLSQNVLSIPQNMTA